MEIKNLIMDNITNEQFNQALKRLPQSAQDFISSKEFNDDLVEVSKKYLLHVNQMGKLSEVIIFTAVGILPTSDFQRNVVKEVGVSGDILNLMIYDINQKIFLPLKKEMYAPPKDLISEGDKETEEEPGENQQNRVSEIPEEKEIETPDTFSQKMTAEYGLSREKVEISDQPNQSEPPQPNNTPPRHDPYREPLP